MRLLLFPDAIIDFLAVNSQMVGNLKAKLDLAPLDAADADPDIIAYMDAFTITAVQYLHGFPPVGEMIVSQRTHVLCGSGDVFAACREMRQGMQSDASRWGKGGVPPPEQRHA